MAANSSGGPNTAVVLLTHNRKELLRSVLSDLLEWTDIGAIIVINNASTDGSSGMIEHDFPSVVHVETTENLGATGGRNLGMIVASELGNEFAFLAEDDTVTDRLALSRCLEAMGHVPAAALVGTSGGSFHRGRVRWGYYRRSQPFLGSNLEECDFVHLDSCLVRLEYAGLAGYLRDDYFIMFEEPEWGRRIRRLGKQILRVDVPVKRLHAGSDSSTAAYPWRAYYQTRNYLRFCIDASSASLWCGFIMRLIHQFAREATGRRWRTLLFRVRGLRDGMTGRMGPRVDPG